MISTLNLQTGALHIFYGMVWINPPNSCPASCCDVDCACTPDMYCQHTSHAETGMCVVNDQGQCLAWLPASVRWTDCGCGSAEGCPHINALLAGVQAQQPRQAGQAWRRWQRKKTMAKERISHAC